jgi:hypothetical protein
MKFKNSIAVSTSGLIFNPDTGESFSVNPMGSEIINYLKEGKDAGEIGQEITKKYNVDQKSFDKDFEDFVGQLRTYTLIEYEE